MQQNDNWIEEIFCNAVVIFWYRSDLLENMGTIHCNTGCDKGDEGIQPPETPGKILVELGLVTRVAHPNYFNTLRSKFT